MIYSSKNRVGSLRLVLSLAGLAIFVFLWGLGYKLSRYEPPQANLHQIPRAKLMSEDERPSFGSISGVLGSAVKAIRTKHGFLTSAFLLFLLTFTTFAELHKELRIRESCQPRRMGCSASLSAFLFRPPPFPVLC